MMLSASFTFVVPMETAQMLQLAALAPQPQTLLNDRELELEDEIRALRASKRDLEDFVYAISHDLRAPLRTMSGFAQLLTEDLQQPLSPAAARDLAGISTGIERMQGMIGRWLSLARREHAELQRERVDLSALAQSVCEDLSISEPQRAVRVSIQPGAIADADAVLIRELLQNLLGNAWKFTQERGVNARIEIGFRVVRGVTEYFVRDNGAGFDPANAEELFRPFRRLRGSERFGGSGVGLAIAQRIVARHGGRIWAESQPGSGATFHFTLGSASGSPLGECAALNACEYFHLRQTGT
jgi:signal transduction histidine kinase